MVKCHNIRCKFNKDNICSKEDIEITYDFDERDESGYEIYYCESSEAK